MILLFALLHNVNMILYIYMICAYVSFLEICWCTNGSRWSIEKPSKRAPCSGTGDPSEQQTKASSRSKESSSPSGTASEKDANASGSKILLSWYYTCFLRPVSGEFAPICIMLGYVQCTMIKKEINKICVFVCVCVCVCVLCRYSFEIGQGFNLNKRIYP